MLKLLALRFQCSFRYEKLYFYSTRAGLASRQPFKQKLKPRAVRQLSDNMVFQRATLGLPEHATAITLTTGFSFRMFF